MRKCVYLSSESAEVERSLCMRSFGSAPEVNKFGDDFKTGTELLDALSVSREALVRISCYQKLTHACF